MSHNSTKHPHYFKDVTHLKDVDVYRILRLFNVTDPCLQHAIKKLLVAGGRGAGKNIEQDVREAIDSCSRFLQMEAEDCNMQPRAKAPDPYAGQYPGAPKASQPPQPPYRFDEAAAAVAQGQT